MFPAFFCAVALLGWAAAQQDLLLSSAEAGRPGGSLTIALRAEPKTLNPVTAIDQNAIAVLSRIHADLIHINRYTQKTEAALAKSWQQSKDGRQFTLELRRGLKFSDGHPFSADDVVFSFRLYLDEQIHSPHRDLLVIGGKPLSVEKLDDYRLRFTFAAPYAAAERVFDSLPILPRHLLEKQYQDGKINEAWGLNAAAESVAGLGAFRLKQIVPGERIVLERNPNYWKVDSRKQKLPYLEQLVFISVPAPDAQVIRFEAGDTQLISGLSAENFNLLARDQQAKHLRLVDVGPGLEYNFLVLNLNENLETRLPQIARKQKWFRDVRFRQAISVVIDRRAIVRLVYQNRAAALATNVTPGNKEWFDAKTIPAAQSLPHAREILRSAGFSWNADGSLVDAAGQPVEFTIVVSSSNVQRTQMATLIQDDLKRLGMKIKVVPMEFRAALDRVLQTYDYEAFLMGIVAGDADPTSEMNVLMSSGQTHIWHLGEKKPATEWEAEIDRLMQQQLITMNPKLRRSIYDQVQEIIAQQLPIICLASPNILVGAKEDLGNFRPGIIEQYTFWNADELYWHTPPGQH